jgi:hypothetical protein
MNDEAHEDRLYAAGLPGLHDAERFFFACSSCWGCLRWGFGLFVWMAVGLEAYDRLFRLSSFNIRRVAT